MQLCLASDTLLLRSYTLYSQNKGATTIKKIGALIISFIASVLLISNMWNNSTAKISNESEIVNDHVESDVTVAREIEYKEQIQQGFWKLIEKDVDPELARKLANVDLSLYEIVEVQCNEATKIGSYVTGSVDVVMRNRESGMFDWLSFSLIVKDNTVLQAELIGTKYVQSFDPKIIISEQERERIEEFVFKVFHDKFPLNSFGYRYRSNLSLPDQKQTLQFTETLLKGANHCYLTEVQYLDTTGATIVTTHLVIRDYQGKMQIEDIKVIEKTAIGADEE